MDPCRGIIASQHMPIYTSVYPHRVRSAVSSRNQPLIWPLLISSCCLSVSGTSLHVIKPLQWLVSLAMSFHLLVYWQEPGVNGRYLLLCRGAALLMLSGSSNNPSHLHQPETAAVRIRPQLFDMLVFGVTYSDLSCSWRDLFLCSPTF